MRMNQLYKMAVREILSAVEFVKDVPKDVAVKMLHGFNETEYSDVFDFNTSHTQTTFVYDENGSFERVGMDIYLFDEKGEEMDIVNTFEELKILAEQKEETQ